MIMDNDSAAVSPTLLCIAAVVCTMAHNCASKSSIINDARENRNVIDWMLFVALIISLEFSGARVIAGIAVLVPLAIGILPRSYLKGKKFFNWNKLNGN